MTVLLKSRRNVGKITENPLATHDGGSEVFKEIDRPAIRSEGKSCHKSEARTADAASADDFPTYASVSKPPLKNPEENSEIHKDDVNIVVENELYSL